MSRAIKMIDIISPNRFTNISSYINKVVIKHISCVHRIHIDNIIMITISRNYTQLFRQLIYEEYSIFHMEVCKLI